VTRAAALALAIILFSGPIAAAEPASKPQIPQSERPGREVDRFFDEFPAPQRAESLLVVPQKKARPKPRPCPSARDRRRGLC
jgi:hypothetical protein